MCCDKRLSSCGMTFTIQQSIYNGQMPYELLERKILLMRRILLTREWCDFRGYIHILGGVILFLTEYGTPWTSNNTCKIIIHIGSTQSKRWCRTTNKKITATITRTVGLLSLQGLICKWPLHRALMVLCNRNATAEINDVCIMWTRTDYRSRSNTHTMVVLTDTSTISWIKTASICDVSLILNNCHLPIFYPFITKLNANSYRTKYRFDGYEFDSFNISCESWQRPWRRSNLSVRSVS